MLSSPKDELNRKDGRGEAKMHYAAMFGDLEQADTLLNGGAGTMRFVKLTCQISTS